MTGKTETKGARVQKMKISASPEGAKLFIGTPWMGHEGVLKKLVWAM